MPITYDNAWGGVDTLNPEEKLPGAYLRNPVGTGWAQTKNQRFIPGLRLPNTQAIGEEVRSPFGDYRPMSFGPMGRGWPGSIEYGGTYDQNWIDNIFPFLPPDFDERYFQMAPAGPADRPAEGRRRGAIGQPDAGGAGELPLAADGAADDVVQGPRQSHSKARPSPDTILFDPENRRFSLVWRISQRLQRTILDFTECWVGPPTRGMMHAKATGKRYIRTFVARLAEDDGRRPHDEPTGHRSVGMVTAVGLDAPSSLCSDAGQTGWVSGDPLSRPQRRGLIGAPMPLPRNWVGEQRRCLLGRRRNHAKRFARCQRPGPTLPSSCALQKTIAPDARAATPSDLLRRIAEIVEVPRSRTFAASSPTAGHQDTSR